MDPTRPSPELPRSHALFARDDWELVRKKALVKACKLTQENARAEDLVQRAIVRALERKDSPWARPHGRLVNFLLARVRKLHDKEVKRAARFPEILAVDDLDDDALEDVPRAVVASREPAPDDEVLAMDAQRTFRKRLDALDALAKDDALVTLLVAAIRRGEDSPIDAAVAEGYSREEVYVARRRLERAAMAVLDEEKRVARSLEEVP